MSEIERIAVLESEMRATRADIVEIKADIKTILSQLSAMTGGKKAILGLAAIIGSVVGAVATIITYILHR